MTVFGSLWVALRVSWIPAIFLAPGSWLCGGSYSAASMMQTGTFNSEKYFWICLRDLKQRKFTEEDRVHPRVKEFQSWFSVRGVAKEFQTSMSNHPAVK